MELPAEKRKDDSQYEQLSGQCGVQKIFSVVKLGLLTDSGSSRSCDSYKSYKG